jgi:hypothetical protein
VETVFVLQCKSNKVLAGLSREPLFIAGYLSFSPIKLLMLKTLPLFGKHGIRELVSGIQQGVFQRDLGHIIRGQLLEALRAADL